MSMQKVTEFCRPPVTFRTYPTYSLLQLMRIAHTPSQSNEGHMEAFMKRMIAGLLVLLFALPVFSQAQRNYSQAELDQMLAPVALYPDPLLSQILMAATYPVEVVEAARWTRANPGLTGDAAVQAVQNEDWDPSVQSLVAFPQVLQRMDENLEWTRSLGDAFLGQQPIVMETVQQLRQRAYAAGNLQSTEQLAVQQQGQQIYIQPANPQMVYVPYYDPLVVYGPWWWPAYRPVVWAPWPGYVRVARPGLSVSFWFGRPVVVHRTVFVDRTRWQHSPYHRRGVEYRDVNVRRQFAASSQARPQVAQPQVVQPQAAPQRREERQTRRYERPPARDLHDSKVLTPQSAQPQRMPAATVAQTPRPQPQAQAQPQPQVRHRPQQEERSHAREERREQRQDARQERRETNPGRGWAKGHERG